MIEFVSNRFTLGGQTASEAIVHVEAGKFSQDIVADPQGMFIFERPRSEEHTSELQSHSFISYAVFCLKKKKEIKKKRKKKRDH